MNDHILKYSLNNKASVTIIYQKGMDITQREIVVRKIEKGLVKAYCFKKKALRNFKKENILSAMIPGLLQSKSRYNKISYQ